eukprot:632597-Pleurochrysis_carterae.AAC.2
MRERMRGEIKRIRGRGAGKQVDESCEEATDTRRKSARSNGQKTMNEKVRGGGRKAKMRGGAGIGRYEGRGGDRRRWKQKAIIRKQQQHNDNR